MYHESPQFVTVLKVFAYLGAAFIALPFFFFEMPAHPIAQGFLRELILLAVFSSMSWMMFWLTLAQILDHCAKTAWHAERMDSRQDGFKVPDEPLSF